MNTDEMRDCARVLRKRAREIDEPHQLSASAEAECTRATVIDVGADIIDALQANQEAKDDISRTSEVDIAKAKRLVETMQAQVDMLGAAAMKVATIAQRPTIQKCVRCDEMLNSSRHTWNTSFITAGETFSVVLTVYCNKERRHAREIGGEGNDRRLERR